MNDFSSVFADDIIALLTDWKICGHRIDSLGYHLKLFDQFCVCCKHESVTLDSKLVTDWIDEEREKSGTAVLPARATAIRKLARLLISTGKDVDAYVLPDGYCKYTPWQKRPPYIFTDDELTALFTAIDNLPKSLHFDSLAPLVAPVMFRLIYTCGLRPNEARELKKTDIHLEAGEILVVHNKTRKQRYVVMSDDMREMCAAYKKELETFAPDNEYFFPRKNGESYSEKQLGTLFRACWRLANPNLSKSKLPRARTYDLRHRFASAVLNKWLDEGQDLYAMLPFLRTYMGHEKLSGTAYYIHILPENLLKSPGVNWEKLNSVMPEVTVWGK
jgi:integrase